MRVVITGATGRASAPRAGLRARGGERDSPLPRVGVAIATRDRRGDLLATLARLRELPERPPVVVADNASRDGTASAVRECRPDVDVLALGENRGAAARNTAVRVLHTPYVAFSDDDSWWEPGALARAADLLAAHPDVGLLAARVLVGPERRLDPACVAMAASPLEEDAGGPGAPGTPVLGFIACGAIVRRSAFLAVGGFDARYDVGGEERLLAADLAAAGWGVRYVPELVAHHWPCPTGRERRPERMVRNDLWSAWLRRPARSLPRATWRALLGSGAGWSTARGAAAAVRGLPWVVRERRPLPREVEAAMRALERGR